jgi:hypothetical protein
MRLPGDLWFNQMLLLAWLAEEEDDDENERFYNQLNGEGRRRRDLHLPQPTLLLPSMETGDNLGWNCMPHVMIMPLSP